jgi:hypothetical protein
VKVPHTFCSKEITAIVLVILYLEGEYIPSHFLEPGDQLRKMFLELLLQVNEVFTGNAVSGDLVDIFYSKSQ